MNQIKAQLAAKFKNNFLDQFLTNADTIREENNFASIKSENDSLTNKNNFNNNDYYEEILSRRDHKYPSDLKEDLKTINSKVNSPLINSKNNKLFNFNNFKIDKENKNSENIKKSMSPLSGYNIFSNITKNELKKVNANSLEVNKSLARKKKNLSVITNINENMNNYPNLLSPVKKSFASPTSKKNIIKSSKDLIRTENQINYDINFKSPKNLKKENKALFSNLQLLNQKKNSQVRLYDYKQLKVKDSNTSTVRLKVATNNLNNFNNFNNFNPKTTPTSKKVSSKIISEKSVNIIKKIKEVSSSNNKMNNANNENIKKKILNEKDIYDKIDTLPNKQKILLQSKNNLLEIAQKENESGTLQLENASKSNNTIDTKTDIYQILAGMNYLEEKKSKFSQNQNITSRQIQYENKNISFKMNTEEEKNHIDFLYSANRENNKVSQGQEIQKKEEFIKNKYKNLLTNYFSC